MFLCVYVRQSERAVEWGSCWSPSPVLHAMPRPNGPNGLLFFAVLAVKWKEFVPDQLSHYVFIRICMGPKKSKDSYFFLATLKRLDKFTVIIMPIWLLINYLKKLCCRSGWSGWSGSKKANLGLWQNEERQYFCCCCGFCPDLIHN